MKVKFILIMGLIASYYGYGQTYYAPTGAGGAGSGGSGNVHLGYGAGAVSTASANVLIGNEAGVANTSGYSNIFIGFQSGHVNTTSTGNVYIGSYAGKESTAGGNTSVGYSSGKNNLLGSFNSSLGWAAGIDSDGSNNVFVGGYSGANSSGSNNVCLGYEAGNTAGASNVFLGYQAGKSETGSNRLYIHNDPTSNPLVYGEFNNKFLKFNAYKVGIGYEGTTGFGSFPGLTGVPNASIYRLFVRGGIIAEEVRIRLQTQWADYVFSENYNLLSLEKVQEYIEIEKHLPNMPTAKEVAEKGIEVGNIVTLQQEKIEELTLYIIEQNERNKEQEKRIETLEKQMQLLLNKQ